LEIKFEISSCGSASWYADEKRYSAKFAGNFSNAKVTFCIGNVRIKIEDFNLAL